METNDRQLKFSDGFTKVIELAKRYALSADDNVIRLKHVLAAFLCLYKSVWAELLGIGNLVMPEKSRFEPKEPEPEDTIYFSSQVNRILSLHGGRLDEISHALGSGNTIGLTELAAAMIVKPRGPVLELLHLNALSPDDFPLRTPSADSITVLEARTAHRLRQAKRLDYDIRVTISAGETSLHITNLRHTVMPSIEDAGWFCVSPLNVSPDDLVGLEPAWAKARKFIAYMDRKDDDVQKPNHILLYGPPGTGKTAFAKSIASSLDRSIICVNASKFTTSANDTRAVRWLQDLFATAERTNSIVFIDECDAFGSRDNVLPMQASVINTLLTLLDGFEDSNVMVIGATNRPEMLDAALLRPGRLHTRIKVDVLRKKEDREKLVDIFCRKAKRRIPSPLKDFIVQATDSWAPANILNVLREMCDLAGAAEPTRTDFAQARNAEFAGEETQRAQLTSEEKRHVALHEAGHALVAALYRHKFIQVTINGFGDNLGFLEHMRDGSVGHSETRLRENIDVALGGHAAERLFGTVSEGSESDFEHATKYARKLLSGGLLGKDNLAVTPEFAEGEHDWQRIRPKVNAILRERLDKTATLLADHKAELKAIADELVCKGTLFSDDVDSILHPAHTATER